MRTVRLTDISTKAARMWRQYVPKRLSEVIAIFSVSTTLFLFIHTTSLNSRLREMEHAQHGSLSGAVDNGELSASGNNEVSYSDRDGGKQHSNRRDIVAITNLKISPKELNNTAKAEKQLLFFNRVPKVGSQTTMHLLNILSRKNHFFFHKDKPNRVEAIKLSTNEERKLTSLIDTFRTPAVYIKHVCFCNFTKYGYRNPIYVNMVRDPVERIISWYYYIRAPWYFVERKRNFPELPLPDPRWLRKDFETCVLSGDPECLYTQGERMNLRDHRRQTLFFCGHDDDCLGFNEEYPLQQAKYNVEKYYSVVGVLEDMNKTLSVLDGYVPRFFKGVKDVYWNEVQQFTKINRNIYKPKVEEKVKDIVRKNFTRELEFYEFCRQRLHLQYVALGLGPNDL